MTGILNTANLHLQEEPKKQPQKKRDHTKYSLFHLTEVKLKFTMTT